MNDFISELEKFVFNKATKDQLIEQYRTDPTLKTKYPKEKKFSHGKSLSYWFPFFREHTAAAKAKIHEHTVGLDEKSISNVINPLLHHLNHLTSENWVIVKHIGEKQLYNEEEAFASSLQSVLKEFEKSLATEYKKYLDSTNAGTFEEFESILLHHLYDKLLIIHYQQHSTTCNCIENARKESEALTGNAIHDYRQYHTGFVAKWIADESAAGHARTEEDYISLLLNQQRFQEEHEMIVYYRKKCGKCNRVLIFDKPFYLQYIAPFNSELITFLKQRMTDLRITSNHIADINFLDDLINNISFGQSFLEAHKFTGDYGNDRLTNQMRYLFYDNVITEYSQQIKKSIHEEIKNLDASRISSYVNQTFARIKELEARHFIVDAPDSKMDFSSDFDCLKRAITIAIDRLEDHLRVTYNTCLTLEHKRDFPEFLRRLLSVGRHEFKLTQYKSFNTANEFPDLTDHVIKAMLELHQSYDDFFQIWNHQEATKGRNSDEKTFIQYCKKLLSYKKNHDGSVVFEMKNYRTRSNIYNFDADFFSNRFQPVIKGVEDFLDQKLSLIPDMKIPGAEAAKIKTSLTVGQLGLLFKLFNKVEAMNFKSDTAATAFAAEHFTTKETESVSKKQARQKSYELTESDYEKVNEIIMKIHNEIVPQLSKASKKRPIPAS